MKDRPEGLDEPELRKALGEWGIDAVSLDYSPVGFGDYHWLVADAGARRWFVTVADLAHKGHCGVGADAAHIGLRRAMDTAVALRAGGLGFVVAPLPTVRGETVHRLGPRYGLSVFPFIAGAEDRFDRTPDRRERAAVLDLLARLHGAAPPPATPAFRPRLAGRAELEKALTELGRPWRGGPYAEPARARLSGRVSVLRRRLEEFDRAIEDISGRAGGLVVTHGEPHPGNMLLLGERHLLVDWDTVCLAPPERDLWDVCADTADVQRYTAASGHRPDPAVMSFYRLRWDLDEIALYTAYFRAPHARTPDADLSWEGLGESLDRVAE